MAIDYVRKRQKYSKVIVTEEILENIRKKETESDLASKKSNGIVPEKDRELLQSTIWE